MCNGLSPTYPSENIFSSSPTYPPNTIEISPDTHHSITMSPLASSNTTPDGATGHEIASSLFLFFPDGNEWAESKLMLI